MEKNASNQAVIYCRVASDVAGGDKLALQESRCRAFAEAQSYSVQHVFSDHGSGQNAGRAGLQQLLNFLATGGAEQTVIVEDLARLARNTHDHFEIVDAIRAANVRLVSIEDTSLSRIP